MNGGRSGAIDQVDIAVRGLTALAIKLLLPGHWLPLTAKTGGSGKFVGSKGHAPVVRSKYSNVLKP